MAIEVIAWVLSNSEAKGADRLVLIAISDSASKDGTNSYPSIRTIAKKAAVDTRSVSRSITHLVSCGQLVVDYNGGPKGCNRYSVIMAPGIKPPTECHPRPDDTPDQMTGGEPEMPLFGDDQMTPRPDDTLTSDPLTPDPRSPEPSLTRPSNSPTAVLTVADASSEAQPTKRGTQIKEDFRPDQLRIAWARDKGFSNEEIRDQTELFVNHWMSASGQNSRKRDWNRAWQVWLGRTKPGSSARPQVAALVSPAEKGMLLAQQLREKGL